MTPQQLVAFRNKHKVTQQGLALVLGCTWQAIRFWEFPVDHKDHRKIPSTTLKVIKFLDKHPEYVLEFSSL